MTTFFKIIIYSNLLFFISCKKKVIEIIPVIEYEDISITGVSADVNSFSFPTIETGYAVANGLYKTINSGTSWTKLAITGNIKEVEFVNSTIGFCISDGYLYKTIDGGQTWVLKISADFVEIAQNGNVVVAKETTFIANLKISTDNGNTFVNAPTLSINGHLAGLKVCDNKAYVFDTQGFSANMINGLNLADANKYVRLQVNANAAENATDVYYSGGTGSVVGGKGFIANSNSVSGTYYLAGFSRSYYGHTYPYYSVDGYEGLMVAVGYHSIATNMDIQNKEPWNEVFDKNRNGFEQTFLKVKFYNKSTFYVSGSNGLIWKATIWEQ